MNRRIRARKRAMIAILAAGFIFAASVVQAEVREFRVVAVELAGTKFWLPSTLIVNRGDQVRIKLVSKVAAPAVHHGYSIPDYKVAVVVDDKEQVVEFKADKAGIFPIGCHLHPAHVGGQLLVK